MKFLETAFGQLAFAQKLCNYGARGLIDRDALDEPLDIGGDGPLAQLTAKMIDNEHDIEWALAQNLRLAFAAAAITLNKSREEVEGRLPGEIVTEHEQFAALTYQIRNAFAHDISEPRWEIRNPKFARVYEVGGVRADLTNLHDKLFEYEHIGGIEGLFKLHQYAKKNWN